MELSDEIIINAPKEKVYAALNDPEILQQCIPGCEELIKHSDTELEAKVGSACIKREHMRRAVPSCVIQVSL